MKPVKTLLFTTAVAGVLASPVAAQETLTFASWGGSYQEAQRKAWLNHVEEELNVEVEEETLSGLADVRVQVRSGSVSWDIVDLGVTGCAIGARQDLLEPLDYDVIDPSGISDLMTQDHWIGAIYYSTVIAWNTNTVDDPPENWAEFWDTEKYPGVRSIRNRPQVQLEMARLADGVKPENLYPLDTDAAFEKLGEIKDTVSPWWSSGAQSVQLAKDGEVDLIAAWDGRLQNAIDDGAPVDYHYNEGLLNADCLAIPKDAPNAELAQKAIGLMVSPEYQARLTDHISYGPINTKAFETGMIPEKRAMDINTAPQNYDKQVVIDAQWWGENGARMRERWDSFVGR